MTAAKLGPTDRVSDKVRGQDTQGLLFAAKAVPSCPHAGTPTTATATTAVPLIAVGLRTAPLYRAVLSGPFSMGRRLTFRPAAPTPADCNLGRPGRRRRRAIGRIPCPASTSTGLSTRLCGEGLGLTGRRAKGLADCFS